MKYLLSFTLLITTLFSIHAQVELNPDLIFFETEGDNIYVIFEATNNSESATQLYWKMEKGEDFPEGWNVSLWDPNICYAAGVYQSSIMLPIYFEPGESKEFRANIYSNDVAGSGYIILRLFDDENFTNEVAVSSPPTTSSVQNELIKDVFIFPNPSADYIGLKNDLNVKNVEFLNEKGQTIKRSKHSASDLYNVEFLPSGSYYLILRDAGDKVISTLPFIKQ
ncbi:MAG: T9SS type A sorting domain-containing protein [Saprospiraceae bacterium]|nr:T9SS type A sorting domain-containing protein [Saprospiraceae bacterium]